MKSDDKSNMPKVRIAVLGNMNVGKSALTVRYLTRRFIGEYRSNTDLLYKQTVTLDCGHLDVEIIDVSVDDDDGFPMEQIQWADACLIVYSIVDRESFNYAVKSLGELRQLQNGPATYLVANKADLDHLREIPETEGASLAASHSVGFCELSVAENSSNIYKIFEKLLIEAHNNNKILTKPRKFSVSKMIGTLIGNNGTRQPLVSNQNGTVVVCNKGELQKSRLIKRRQAFTATASL